MERDALCKMKSIKWRTEAVDETNSPLLLVLPAVDGLVLSSLPILSLVPREKLEVLSPGLMSKRSRSMCLNEGSEEGSRSVVESKEMKRGN